MMSGTVLSLEFTVGIPQNRTRLNLAFMWPLFCLRVTRISDQSAQVFSIFVQTRESAQTEG